MTSGLKLVALVWESNGKDAWTALNFCMRTALRLAIGSGMEFVAADLKTISAKMRPHYWLGEDMWEYPYAQAITVGNMSFIKAFEEFTGREPFFANGVECGSGDGYLNRDSTTRGRSRLALGFSIGNWRTKVTSITNDYVMICTYEGDERKPKTRNKYTREKLAELYPAPKKPKKAVPHGSEGEAA